MAEEPHEESSFLKVFKDLLKYAERKTCLHDETHRGGYIWEICDSCGAKWADDEGGKPANAHEWPAEIAAAQQALDAHKVTNLTTVTPPAVSTVDLIKEARDTLLQAYLVHQTITTYSPQSAADRECNQAHCDNMRATVKKLEAYVKTVQSDENHKTKATKG